MIPHKFVCDWVVSIKYTDYFFMSCEYLNCLIMLSFKSAGTRPYLRNIESGRDCSFLNFNLKHFHRMI